MPNRAIVLTHDKIKVFHGNFILKGRVVMYLI
jgi:hypothetical protein